VGGGEDFYADFKGKKKQNGPVARLKGCFKGGKNIGGGGAGEIGARSLRKRKGETIGSNSGNGGEGKKG